MKETELRRALAEVLRDSSVFFLRDESVEEQFIDGRYDVPLDQLDVDSLAAMEICIALEVNWGTALVPEDLQRVGSLQTLVGVVMEGISVRALQASGSRMHDHQST
jgi:acyl carrier protein